MRPMQRRNAYGAGGTAAIAATGAEEPGAQAGAGSTAHPATLAAQHEHSVWMNARSEGVGSRLSGRSRYTERRIGSAPSRAAHALCERLSGLSGPVLRLWVLRNPQLLGGPGLGRR